MLLFDLVLADSADVPDVFLGLPQAVGAVGADDDFSGFEHIRRQPHHQMKTEETVDAVTHIPAEERIKKVDVEDKIRHIDPEDF